MFYIADNFMRRIMDIFVSLVGLVLLSPLFLLVAIAIKRSSPGPVFYWGARMGMNGKLFRILKFRTMYERKESYDGPKVTAENDPRVFPLGRVLRQTKINELPQLWNVLIGDMSMVGPRPEDPDIVEAWPEEVRKEILSAKPGITSPASVVYRNEEDLLQSSSLMDTYLWDILPTKLRLDQIYVRNRSVLTDLDVIFWTAVALIPRLKAFSIPQYLLYWGPVARFTYHYLGWFFVDFIVSFLVVSTAGTLRRLSTPLNLGLELSIAIALAIALLFSLINTLAGLNRINWGKARALDAIDLAFSAGIVTLVVLVANLVFPVTTRFPISVIIVSGMLSYIGFVAVRYRARLLTGVARYWLRLRGHSMPPLGERVIIVGAGEVARFAVWLLTNENMAQAFSIVGMVDDNPRKIGTKVEGVPVIGTTTSLAELVKKHDIGLVLFAITEIAPTEHDRILSDCQDSGARVIPIPDILDNLRAQFPKNEVEREVHFNKVLHSATIDRLTGGYNRTQFMRLAEVEFSRAQRYGHPLSIITIHVDYERPDKATYARTVVSQILQVAARRSLENIRGIDLFGRLNDDTLVILLPETDEEGARLVSNRLKGRLTAGPVKTSRGEIHCLMETRTVTNRDADFLDAEDMVNAAINQVNPRQNMKEKVAQQSSTLK
jgi:diguanylate cyclase (GGDEF)-like protein